MSIRPGQSLSPRLVIVFDRTIMFLAQTTQSQAMSVVISPDTFWPGHLSLATDWFGISRSPGQAWTNTDTSIYISHLGGHWAMRGLPVWRYLNFWQNVPFLSAGSGEVWLVLTGRTPRLGCFAGVGTAEWTGSNFVYLIILAWAGLGLAGDVETKKMSSHDRSSGWYGVNWVMVHTEYRIQNTEYITIISSLPFTYLRCVIIWLFTILRGQTWINLLAHYW